MKKLILTLAILCSLFTAKGQVTHVCSTSVHVEKNEFFRNLRVTTNPVDSTRTISSRACCLVSGPDDAIFIVDSANGVYPHSSGNMYIRWYFDFELINQCNQEVADYYKNLFYFGSMDAFYSAPGVVSEHFQDELQYMDHLLDPSVYGAIPLACDPWDDLRTCITKGRNDCYDIHFNIGKQPDGIYRFVLDINFPPTFYNTGEFEEGLDIPMLIVGNTATPVTSMPTASVTPPADLKIKKDLLSWTPVQGATSYDVYRAAATQGQGGWYVQDTTSFRVITSTVQSNTVITTLGGKWAYRVKAKSSGCTSEFSEQIIR